MLLNWTWSYVSYKRGARLITSTGWHPDLEATQVQPVSRRSPLAKEVPPLLDPAKETPLHDVA